MYNIHPFSAPIRGASFNTNYKRTDTPKAVHCSCIIFYYKIILKKQNHPRQRFLLAS